MQLENIKHDLQFNGLNFDKLSLMEDSLQAAEYESTKNVLKVLIDKVNEIIDVLNEKKDENKCICESSTGAFSGHITSCKKVPYNC